MKIKNPNRKCIQTANVRRGRGYNDDVLFRTSPDASLKAHREEFVEGIPLSGDFLCGRFGGKL